MTPAMRIALDRLRDGPLDETGRVVADIKRRTLSALVARGWAKWHPYGDPPNWRITVGGRQNAPDKP